jgi:hypothetical protein
MTDWIFQGNRKRYDLDAAISASRRQRWSTPRYRDATAVGDRVWLQVVGPTDIRFDYRIDPALLRVELLADAKLGSFRPFRGFQGSTVPLPPDVARALSERAAPRLEALAPGELAE